MALVWCVYREKKYTSLNTIKWSVLYRIAKFRSRIMQCKIGLKLMVFSILFYFILLKRIQLEKKCVYCIFITNTHNNTLVKIKIACEWCKFVANLKKKDSHNNWVWRVCVHDGGNFHQLLNKSSGGVKMLLIYCTDCHAMINTIIFVIYRGCVMS